MNTSIGSKRKIIILSVIAGLTMWLIAASLDHFATRGESHAALVPGGNDLAFRSLIGVSLLSLGLVVAGFVSRQKNAGRQLQNEIAERRKAEESLQAAVIEVEAEKAKLEAMIEAIGDGLSIQDPEYRILYQNEIARKMFGNHIGEYCYAVYERRDHVCAGCPIAMSFADGRIHATERSNPSRTLHVEITASPVLDAAGKVVAGIEVVRDITARKQAEYMLKESEDRYRNLIENALDMIQSVSPDGHFNFVNASWLRTMGYTQEDLASLTIFDILHPETKAHCLEVFRKVMGGEAVKNVTASFVARDGRRIEVEGNVNVRAVDGRVTATEGIFRDITERRRAEEERTRLESQLRHAQKIEAIGTLTAGVAHEFNNIMTAIIGFGELVQEGMAQDDPSRTYMDMVLASAMRATHLTQGLLAYSRKQIMHPRPVSVNGIVRNVEKLLSRLLGEHIELRSLQSEEEMMVMADAGQIEQVLVNLATNARDAMPDGGLLTITTGRVTQDHAFIRRHNYGKPGTYAVITVADTGMGIAEETRERIFEPFFTTKESGKGTGLGLAVVYGIVKQHGGYIDVASGQGRGTLFTIYLPAIESAADETESPVVSPMRRGTETVLVAEDDPTVRSLTRTVLGRFGYNVITAENGEDAVARFRENRGEVRLLILDIMMPRMNGDEAYLEIRRMAPHIKVIFISGYPEDVVRKDRILGEQEHFIAKPVSRHDLITKVREVLDG